MPFFSFLKDGGSMGQIIAHDPERLMPFVALTETALNGPSPIPQGQRELIAAYVSNLNRCGYCAGSHFAVAVEHGIDAELLEQLSTDIQTASVDDKAKPLFHIANKLTLTPYKMTQSDIDRALDAGWEERAVRDVVLITALFNFANRMVDGHGVESQDWDDYRKDARELAKDGYAGRVRKLAGDGNDTET